MRRWWETGELLDFALDPLWTAVAAVALGMVAFGIVFTLRGESRFDALHSVATIVETQAAQTQAARATIYPAATIADATFGAVSGVNCSGAPSWCLEKVIYQRDTDGDHYTGYATLTGTNGQKEVATFTTTGFTAGVAQGVTITGRTRIATGDNVLYASIPVTSIATDARNPARGVVSTYLAAVGAAPVARTITWGPNLAVGSNNLELVQWNIAGITTTTGMAIATLPAKNLAIVTGFATPTPEPPFNPALTTSSVVYVWPSTQVGLFGATSGPATFQVQMPNYHDAFFAETSTCAQPNPVYVPGSSPVYVPGLQPAGDFGVSGPWEYPNPNPTTPPNQNSGPATFGASPLSPGLCNINIYTTYTPRSGAVLAGEPTPFPEPVQVMGWLTLTYGAGTATSQTAGLSIPAASITQGSTFTIGNTKTDDQTALTLQSGFVQGGCSSYLSVVSNAQTGGGSTSGTASGSFKVTVSTLPASATTCTIEVSDQYNEPWVDVAFNLPAAPPGPLSTLSSVEFNPSAVADLSTPWHVAEWINHLLGGGVAEAGGTSCSYAQLYYYNASGTSVLDANGVDGFNATDSNGCVTNGQVRLWATESNYSGSFFDQSNCSNYATISLASWTVGSYSTITPIASTTGCAFPVTSTAQTVANGGAKYTNVIVDSNPDPCANPAIGCYVMAEQDEIASIETDATLCRGGTAVYVQIYNLATGLPLSSASGPWEFANFDGTAVARAGPPDTITDMLTNTGLYPANPGAYDSSSPNATQSAGMAAASADFTSNITIQDNHVGSDGFPPCGVIDSQSISSFILTVPAGNANEAITGL